MIRPVAKKMSALTQASQVLQLAIAGIVVEVGSGQNDSGLAHPHCFLDAGLAGQAAAMIAPDLTSLVIPPSIRQAANDLTMRAPAVPAHAAGTLAASRSDKTSASQP